MDNKTGMEQNGLAGAAASHKHEKEGDGER